MRELTQPASVHWVDGSEEENDALFAQMHAIPARCSSSTRRLWPGCYYARSDAERRRPRRAAHVRLLALEGRGRADQQLGEPVRDAAQAARSSSTAAMAGPDDVRAAVQHGARRLADVADRRAAHRLALRRRQHADHGAHRPAGARGDRPRRASASCRACTASARRSRPAQRTCPGRATTTSTSSTSRRRARSGRTDRATAATRCSARSASACASPRTSRATRAGWPSTC